MAPVNKSQSLKEMARYLYCSNLSKPTCNSNVSPIGSGKEQASLNGSQFSVLELEEIDLLFEMVPDSLPAPPMLTLLPVKIKKEDAGADADGEGSSSDDDLIVLD